MTESFHGVRFQTLQIGLFDTSDSLARGLEGTCTIEVAGTIKKAVSYGLDIIIHVEIISWSKV